MNNIYIIVFFTAVVILYLVRIIICYNYAKIKGKYGERQVAKTLMRLPNGYTIFNDVYILENGKSSQINHVVLSPYGIFVIETKNYKGWIYGDEKAQYWIKNMYGTKYQFYNPLLQNYSHVKGLQALFGFSSQHFIPIVVFANAAKIKGNYPYHNVINVSELISTIEAYQRVVFTEDVLATAINKLTYSSFETNETASLHKAQVRADITSRKKAIQRGQCPCCGGSLVYKVGRYGKFWGCSNYPKCHYTLKK